MPMANDLYFENYQDVPKHKKKYDKAGPAPKSPSTMTMIFILGYAAALKVIKTKTVGDIMILLN